MRRQLPNLNQLRAFEAAARHRSFKHAAEELCVTQAAISHQIKALEEHLGLDLFRRRTRRVEVTEEAEKLGLRLTRLFDEIEAATWDLVGERMTGQLNITVPPYFSDRILMPKLAEFHAAHPGITVVPSPSAQLVNLNNSTFDAAIRYGDGDWDGLSAIRLHRTELIPVAVPSLVQGRSLPLNPEEIAALPLCCLKGQEHDWLRWFEQVGFASDGLDISTFAAGTRVIDLAYSGRYAALMSTLIVAEDLEFDRLVCLNPETLESPRAMHLAYPTRDHTDPRLTLFADWLSQEISNISKQVPKA